MPTDPVAPDEAAKLLRVSGTTIRSWIAAGKMPAVRIGGRLWLDRADVLAMVQRVKPEKGPALMSKGEAMARDQETERVLKLAGIQ